MTRTAETRPRRSPRRIWLFRLGAVSLGLSVFALVEVVCVLGGWGRPTAHEDPFVGFSDVHPLFVRDEDAQKYRIPESRLDFFAAESFPVRKEDDTFRIFCLGGSTVQGRPFSKETSFTTWLELGLQQADDHRDWQVVNCGGVSYASYRLVPILKECLGYQPDLFIICTGHNEFLEDRTYAPIKHAPAWIAAPHEFLAGFRTYVLLRELIGEVTGRSADPETDRRDTLPAEVDAILDYKNGIKEYHRDPQWRTGVIEHYEQNLRRMLALANEAGVPVILIRPPSNLRGCPPFKSEHRAGLSDEEQQQCRKLVDRARAHYRDDMPEAIRLLRKATRIDDQYAATFYELGKCYEAVGQYEAARKALLRARDLDICPLRIISSMEKRLAEVADDWNVPLVDAHELLEQQCANGILGGPILVDHVHPSFRGHQLIADALIATMIRRGRVEPVSNWQERASRAYTRHFESLDDFYFLRGKRTLESVNGWARGRAEGPPIESRDKRNRRQNELP